MTPNQTMKNINEFIIVGFDTFKNQVEIGVVLLSAYLLVMLANLTNVCFIFKDKQLHQPMYLFICNLAIVDMLYCTSSCPTMIGVLLAGYKTISYGPCMMQTFTFGLGFVMEMLTLTIMAFDRLIAIVNPLQYNSILTNFRTIIITIMLWMAGSAISSVIPTAVVPLPICYTSLKFMFCDFGSLVRVTCADPNPYFNLIAIISVVLLFGTFTFIFGTYVTIIVVVVKMKSGGNKKKVFNTCFSHLIVVLCYYGPAFAITVLTRTGVVLTLEERHGIRIGTILGPSLVNPFIYSLRTKEIRKQMIKTVYKISPVKQSK